jgi:hypothetical protein
MKIPLIIHSSEYFTEISSLVCALPPEASPTVTEGGPAPPVFEDPHGANVK